MMLEINQENVGAVELMAGIPPELTELNMKEGARELVDIGAWMIDTAIPYVMRGHGFVVLMQEFRGVGFAAWYSRFQIQGPTVLRARGDIAVVELRIAWKRHIRGTWERMEVAGLPPHHFQLGFVPYIVTRAMLLSWGIDYRLLDTFINHVQLDQPAELSGYPHPCSVRMIDCVHGILQNHHSAPGKARLLQESVTLILMEALEEVSQSERPSTHLKPFDFDALYHIRSLIANECPSWFGISRLLQAGGINAYTLHTGFKQLFHRTPYEYFLDIALCWSKNGCAATSL